MKTKTTHTSGPWGIPDVGTSSGSVMVSKSDGLHGWDGMIASVDAGNYASGREEGLSNARLIAAAPDQHAILCKIAERLDRWQRFGISAGPKGKDADFEELKSEVNAAIRKAQGQ